MTALSPRLQLLFEKTRSLCFGRFLMEIPATATVVYGPAEVETPIEFFKGHGSKLAEHLAERLVDVENERELLLDDDIPHLPLFGKVIDGAIPGQKIVFGSKNKIGYTIYSFVPIGNDLFVQHLNSVLPQYDRVATLNRVASHLRSRTEDEVPEESGTCLEGGFVPLEQKYERVTVGIRLKEFPDVHFSVEVHKNQDRLAESSRMELMREQARDDAEERGLGSIFARIKILRREARQLDSWKGMEIGTRTPAHAGDTEAHEFRFQSLGAVNDPLQPQLDVRLDSGVKLDRKASVKPSITDEEAMGLWDKLTSSIRVRPLAGNQNRSVEPSKVPLNSIVSTGGTCSQTGWWQCIEDDNVEGGRRRHFAAGGSMPHAILLGERNLWQKITGDRPRHTRATVWKLVDYDAEPALPSSVQGVGTSPFTAAAQMPSLPERANTKAPPPSIS